MKQKQALEQVLIENILCHFPDVAAIYLFGSFAEDLERPDSDIDLALLFEPHQARATGNLAFSDCRAELELAVGRCVDLVNLRCVSTVFQKEVIGGRRIYCRDEYAADEFEMLTISYYQKLNEERAGILEEFAATGRAWQL